MIIYSTLVAMAAVGTSPMPVFFALVIFYQPEVVHLNMHIDDRPDIDNDMFWPNWVRLLINND